MLYSVYVIYQHYVDDLWINIYRERYVPAALSGCLTPRFVIEYKRWFLRFLYNIRRNSYKKREFL